MAGADRTGMNAAIAPGALAAADLVEAPTGDAPAT